MKTAHENVSSLCARFFSLSSLVSTVSEAVMLTEELAEVVLGNECIRCSFDFRFLDASEEATLNFARRSHQSVAVWILRGSRTGFERDPWINILPRSKGVEPIVILGPKNAILGLDHLSNDLDAPTTFDLCHFPRSTLQRFIELKMDLAQRGDESRHVLRPLVARLPIFDLEEIECENVWRSDPPTLDVEESKRPLRVDLLADKLVRTTATARLERTNSVMCHG